MNRSGYKIWIDLDNSPHVPFFVPIIRELAQRNCEVFLTARNCFQVCGLADRAGLEYLTLGRHFGSWKVSKAAATLMRALQLAPCVIRERPAVAVSHGSRAQRILAAALGIPAVLIIDYEHAMWLRWFQPAKLLVPEVLAEVRMKTNPDLITHYPGIKEDVYVPEFVPRPGLIEELGLDAHDIIVTIRPPADNAHYRNPESGRLLLEAIAFLSGRQKVRLVILPRTEWQARQIRLAWPQLWASRRIIIPEAVVDGLNLIWHSDLVLSGGGTMNREAAALGVPVYSIFRGKVGAVDRYLERTGRLVLLRGPQDLAKVRVEKRRPGASPRGRGSKTLYFIVREIIEAASKTGNSRALQDRRSWRARIAG